MIRLQSVHEPLDDDGVPRFLIDWKWPTRKHHNQLRLAGWPRRLLPDKALWDWFHHAPLERLEAFRRRYFKQLDLNEKDWVPIACASVSEGAVLLHDPKKAGFAPARFLKEFLELRLKTRRIPELGRKHFARVPAEGVAPSVEKAISRKSRLPLKPERPYKAKLTPVQAAAEKKKGWGRFT